VRGFDEGFAITGKVRRHVIDDEPEDMGKGRRGGTIRPNQTEEGEEEGGGREGTQRHAGIVGGVLHLSSPVIAEDRPPGSARVIAEGWGMAGYLIFKELIIN
jgi:hypothetical protein